MKIAKLSVFVASAVATLLGTSITVQAEDPWSLSGQAGATTDYVYRGVTLTDGHPAVQGTLTLTHLASGLHASLWGSPVDFGSDDPARAEVQFGAGRGGNLAGLSYDLGILYTIYPGAPGNLHYAYGEGYALATGHWSIAEITATVYYTPSYFGKTGAAWFAETEAAVPVGSAWKVVALAGYAGVGAAAGPRYAYWSVGVTRSWKGLTAALRYHGTDLPNCDVYCRDRVVLSLAYTF